MSIINKIRLEEFANGLWAKIKMEIGNGIVNIAFNEVTSILTATKYDNTTIDVDLKTLIGVKDVTYDAATKMITVSKGDNTTSTIDLSSFVEKWRDLEFTSDITFTNLVNGLTMENGHYGSDGNFNADNRFRSIKVQCTPGKTYRRCNNSQFQNKVCNLRGGADGSTFIKSIEWQQTPFRIGSRQIWEVTIPNDTNITHFTTSWNEGLPTPQSREMMVWDASINPPQAYVPNTMKAKGVLVGSDIKMEFKPFQTGLSSVTVDDAIREVALKVATGGKVQSVNGQAPNFQGDITLDASHFSDIYSKTEVDGKFVLQADVANAANKIPRLNAQGKLETSILPAVSINETFTINATNQADAETKAMALVLENGDVVVANIGAAPDVKIKKYLCGDATKNTFAEKFIELTFPTDGITRAELEAELLKYVAQTETGTGANQVLRLDAQGKIDDNNLKIATAAEINTIINNLN